MAVADPALPARLLAGGGPSAPAPAVLAAMTTPVIGQFDPAFTRVMDDVMDMARAVFATANARCFAISGLASAGLEALLNSLLEPGDPAVAVGGPTFVAAAADLIRRGGGSAQGVDADSLDGRLVIVPLVDAESGQRLPIRRLAEMVHARGGKLIVDATLGLAGCELRVDEWAIDACVAGVDFCLGAPSGMALVTYSDAVEARLRARSSASPTSYLDLAQLQAYWSPERLNHHTAPTSLIYGLHEALRLCLAEGLAASIARHVDVGQFLRAGLAELGLEVSGDAAYAIVQLPPDRDDLLLRRRLLDDHAVYISVAAPHTLRLGLLAADATRSNARRVILAMRDALQGPGRRPKTLQ